MAQILGSKLFIKIIMKGATVPSNNFSRLEIIFKTRFKSPKMNG